MDRGKSQRVGGITDTVELDWKNAITWDTGSIKSSKVEYLDKYGYYAIFAGKYDTNTKKWLQVTPLFYVGQAFKKILRERIPEPHDPAYVKINKWLKDNPGFTAYVMVGVITRKSADKLTQELVDDIECCLIFSNQPLYNDKCMESYAGRDLLVSNTGAYQPLKTSSKCTPSA